jgi:enoyl-CoA hydratase/carnithine racemase
VPEQPQEPEVLLTVDDGVATITLNRPDRMNAYNPRLGAMLGASMAECDDRDDVRAVLLTGAGRAFCAGADMGDEDVFGAGLDRYASEGAAARRLSPQRVRKPVIAALNGHAVGVGLTIAMQCDVRYVNEDAKLGFVFARRGIIGEASSHWIVPRIVGLSRAAELMLSGRIFSGRQAAEWGLASQAMPAADVVPAAVELARDIAVNTAPVSIAISKRLLWESLALDEAESARRESALLGWVGAQPDAREGVASFLEKRDPQWKMRVSQDLPDWPA